MNYHYISSQTNCQLFDIYIWNGARLVLRFKEGIPEMIAQNSSITWNAHSIYERQTPTILYVLSICFLYNSRIDCLNTSSLASVFVFNWIKSFYYYLFQYLKFVWVID